MSNLLTLGEAAIRMGLSIHSLRRWVADINRAARGQPHRVPPLREVVRIGRAVRIREAEVDRIIEGGTTRNGPAAKA